MSEVKKIEGLVSVLVPCYNAEKYIESTILSVLNQTYPDFELIIVDDGSSDNSRNVVKSFLKEDDRIQYYYQSNKGMCATRNVAIGFAKGEYYLFLDNDDTIDPTFIEDRYSFLADNREYGLCGGDILKINSNNELLDNGQIYFGPSENLVEEILLYDIKVMSIPSNLLIRRDVLEDNNIKFNALLSSAGDRYFLLELAKVTKCANIKAAPVRYRIHNSSMSSTLSQKLLDDFKLYILLLIKNDLIPSNIKNMSLSKNYYMASAMSFKLHNYMESIYFFFQYLFYSTAQKLF